MEWERAVGCGQIPQGHVSVCVRSSLFLTLCPSSASWPKGSHSVVGLHDVGSQPVHGLLRLSWCVSQLPSEWQWGNSLFLGIRVGAGTEKYSPFHSVWLVPGANLGERGFLCLQSWKQEYLYYGCKFSPGSLDTFCDSQWETCVGDSDRSEQRKAWLTKKKCCLWNKMIAGVEDSAKSTWPSHAYSSPPEKRLIPSHSSHGNNLSEQAFSRKGCCPDFQWFVLSALTNILCTKWMMGYLLLFLFYFRHNQP